MVSLNEGAIESFVNNASKELKDKGKESEKNRLLEEEKIQKFNFDNSNYLGDGNDAKVLGGSVIGISDKDTLKKTKSDLNINVDDISLEKPEVKEESITDIGEEGTEEVSITDVGEEDKEEGLGSLNQVIADDYANLDYAEENYKRIYEGDGDDILKGALKLVETNSGSVDDTYLKKLQKKYEGTILDMGEAMDFNRELLQNTPDTEELINKAYLRNEQILTGIEESKQEVLVEILELRDQRLSEYKGLGLNLTQMNELLTSESERMFGDIGAMGKQREATIKQMNEDVSVIINDYTMKTQQANQILQGLQGQAAMLQNGANIEMGRMNLNKVATENAYSIINSYREDATKKLSEAQKAVTDREAEFSRFRQFSNDMKEGNYESVINKVVYNDPWVKAMQKEVEMYPEANKNLDNILGMVDSAKKIISGMAEGMEKGTYDGRDLHAKIMNKIDSSPELSNLMGETKGGRALLEKLVYMEMTNLTGTQFEKDAVYGNYIDNELNTKVKEFVNGDITDTEFNKYEQDKFYSSSISSDESKKLAYENYRDKLVNKEVRNNITSGIYDVGGNKEELILSLNNNSKNDTVQNGYMIDYMMKSNDYNNGYFSKKVTLESLNKEAILANSQEAFDEDSDISVFLEGKIDVDGNVEQMVTMMTKEGISVNRTKLKEDYEDYLYESINLGLLNDMYNIEANQIKNKAGWNYVKNSVIVGNM